MAGCSQLTSFTLEWLSSKLPGAQIAAKLGSILSFVHSCARMHEVTLKINVIQEDYNSEKWLRDLFDVLAPPIEQELLKQKSLIKVTIPVYFFVVPEFPLFSNGAQFIEEYFPKLRDQVLLHVTLRSMFERE